MTEESDSAQSESDSSCSEECQVYLGNLAWQTTAQQCREALMLHSDATVLNVDTGHLRNGRSRGWALVRTDTPASAAAIISRSELL